MLEFALLGNCLVLWENFYFALYTANNDSIFWEKNSLGSTKVCFIKKPPIRNVENFLKLNFDLIQTCKILHKENHYICSLKNLNYLIFLLKIGKTFGSYRNCQKNWSFEENWPTYYQMSVCSDNLEQRIINDVKKFSKIEQKHKSLIEYILTALVKV